MKAMILAAGVGSRLDPLTRCAPKPMVPVVNRPVMEHIINLLRTHGFDEIMVNTFYLGKQIHDYFGDGSQFGVHIHWSPEEQLWGDAGSVRRVADFFGDGTFLVTGGDDLTDMNLTELIQAHKARQALCTIALTEVDDPSEYGIAEIAEDGRVKQFQEKPSAEEAVSLTANTGVYVIEPEVFNHIPADEFYLFGRQLLPKLLANGQALFGHSTNCYWVDVGMHHIYRAAQRDCMLGKVQVDFAAELDAQGRWIGDGCVIDPTADVSSHVVLGSDCTIGAGAVIGAGTVLGKGCLIEGGATVRQSVLWDNVRIGPGVELYDCVVGHGVAIGPNGVCRGANIVNQQ